MRKVSFLIAFLMLATSFAFVGCTDDEGDATAPTVVVTEQGDANEYLPGDVITYKVLVTSNNVDLATFTVNTNVAGADGTGIDLAATGEGIFEEDGTSITKNNTSITVYYDYVIPAQPEGTGIEITFAATDDDGSSASETATFDIAAGVVTIDLEAWSATLGGLNSNTGSFCVASDGTVYTISEAANAQAEVDLIYFNGSTNGPTLASPDNDDVFGTDQGQISSYGVHNWSTRNATRFAVVSADDFEAATNADLATIFEGTTPSDNMANGLDTGDVVIFMTGTSSEFPEKMGIIKIGAINTGDDTVAIEAKVEGSAPATLTLN